MSREYAGRVRDDGWVMRCDAEGCKTRSDVRPRCADLSLPEFVAAGWFIARTHGDRCPTCVAAAGGMEALVAERAARGGAGAPHDLMLPKAAIEPDTSWHAPGHRSRVIDVDRGAHFIADCYCGVSARRPSKALATTAALHHQHAMRGGCACPPEVARLAEHPEPIGACTQR